MGASTRMTTTQVEEPDLVEEKNVDSNGRLYLGKSWSGDTVKVILKKVTASTNLDKHPDTSGLDTQTEAGDRSSDNPDADGNGGGGA